MTSTFEPVDETRTRVDDPLFYDTRRAADFEYLRRKAPVYRYESGNVWVVSKYDDARTVLRTPDVFSSSKGILLNDAKVGESVSETFYERDAELLLTLDPPRHGAVRRAMASAFTPKRVAAMEDAIRGRCRELVGAIPADTPFDFVHDIARVIPIFTIGKLLGIPDDELDIDRIVFWSDEHLKMGHALSKEEFAEAAANTAEMTTYLLDLLGRKRAKPEGDLLSTLAAAELDNAALSEANILGLSITTLVAGNETTRSLLTGAMWSLANHPEQAALLAGDPSLCKQAVEEVLRWLPPTTGAARNATKDVELRGQKIPAGDYVFTLFVAANRDEDYWDRPDTFDVTRSGGPAPLSFGHGPHTCIGAALARLEVRCFLEEYFARFAGVSLTGDEHRVPSILTRSWSDMTVAAHPKS